MNYFFAIFSNILWGSTFLATKELLNYFSPLEITSIRFSLTFLMLFAWSLVNKNNFKLDLFKKHFKNILFLGVISYTLLYYFQIEGLKYISTGLSAVIMLTTPIFAIGMNAVVNKEKVTLRDILLIGLSFLGSIILVIDKLTAGFSFQFLGVMLTLLSSLCLAANFVYTKYIFNKANTENTPYPSATLTLHTMLVGTFFSVLMAAGSFGEIASRIVAGSSLLWFLYLSIFCSFVAFLMWNYALKNTESSFTSSSMYLKTPVAILLGIIFLHETVSLEFIVGTLVICSALYLQKRSVKK